MAELRSLEKIGDVIGITARQLRSWRRVDPDGAPKDNNLEAWQAYAKKRGRFTGGKDSEALKVELLSEQVRKLRLLNDAAEEKYVPLADIMGAIRPTLAAFRQALDSLPHRAAIKLGGDYHEVVEVLRSEVDIALRTFSGAAWFDDQVAVKVPKVEIDVSDIPPAEGQVAKKRPRGRPKKKP